MKVDGHGQAKVLTPHEIGKLFKAFGSDRDRACLVICLYTGCRISEACSMLTTDAYDAAGVRMKITLRKANTKGKQETRQIPVNSVLRGYLEIYRSRAGKQYLFPRRHGREHINPKSADEILRETCDRLGLVGVSTHSFRRTALTQMSSAGIPLRVIQEISGHRSLQALQRYLEVSKLQLEGAIASLFCFGFMFFPFRN
ncbi:MULTISPECIES: site-specific integrase [Trichocoleus]|uniref:Site-specific integrase n=1 Tax=Trichocoleus desertorum GB2-A4 TaxID=2933944 RepID=A0ABV0JDY2_9CYAN|nr:site-specific integrase [Trichocoleus sp. FACHB-46]MBD1864150.1 site-specific integrase [Trichocoleus sp. FACHB-46]